MLAIEKDIPIPAKCEHQPRKYPFKEMEIGDSFFTPATIASPTTIRSAANYNSKLLGRQFTSRIEGEGTRIWRVA